MARFTVFQDRSGQYRWRLQADNNRITADSGEGYATRSGARQAAERVKVEVPSATIEDQ
jgi:uncharacterized protein YegP (UPF0339 family)